ncbi:MAG: FtsQ-type POTRA domain-containing protein [Sphingopyxis terrae]|nr:FtsQ-type POTRA domain-containing protein [Sphingopyxis terrae]
MSSTRIKRAKAPPRRPSRAPKRRRSVKQSRLNMVINALPISPAQLQRVANWTIGIGLAGVLVLGAEVTGVTAKIHEEWAQAVGRAGFQVKKVEVVGADRIDRLKVYDIALAQKDRSMAAVELDDVRRDLMQYGWIKDARVSRRLPDTLVVDIVERTPAAIWQNDGRLSLIDDSGVVLEPVTVATMPDLPLVIGPNANRRAQDLDALLAEARLHEGHAEAKAAHAKSAHMDGENRLLGRGILRFDMRDPSRFVLRMPHEGQVAPSKIDDARAAADAVSAGQANEG